MGYIPARDRFILDEATAAAFGQIEDQIDAEAVRDYHRDECGGAHDATACPWGVGVGYRPSTFEVIAYLAERGLLRDPSGAVAHRCSTDVDAVAK